MEQRPITIDPLTFPKEVRPFLQEARLLDSSCGSGAKVIRCRQRYGESDHYIKIAERDTLQREADMTALFAKYKLCVPLVLYLTQDDKDYMVTKAAVGEDLTTLVEEPKRVCQILAEGMQKLHSVDIADMPLSLSMEAYQAYPEMQADTCIHGDFCLPNVIWQKGKFDCFIDMGQAGRGDRHIDLYWALWSLQFNLKTDRYSDYFLDAYGRERVDKDRFRIAKLVEEK